MLKKKSHGKCSIKRKRNKKNRPEKEACSCCELTSARLVYTPSVLLYECYEKICWVFEVHKYNFFLNKHVHRK